MTENLNGSSNENHKRNDGMDYLEDMLIQKIEIVSKDSNLVCDGKYQSQVLISYLQNEDDLSNDIRFNNENVREKLKSLSHQIKEYLESYEALYSDIEMRFSGWFTYNQIETINWFFNDCRERNKEISALERKAVFIEYLKTDPQDFSIFGYSEDFISIFKPVNDNEGFLSLLKQISDIEFGQLSNMIMEIWKLLEISSGMFHVKLMTFSKD